MSIQRIIHGDSRQVMPALDLEPERTVIVTDPVWPNAPADSFGVKDPTALFADVMRHAPRVARRVVVQLGCVSDVRFLAGIPAELPFVRVCWLRYACPSYLGSVLNSGDAAYVFGSKEAAEGRTVLPGECTARLTKSRDDKPRWHPMPRSIEHLRWLIATFTRAGDTILDPFAGSGTTLVAARQHGRDAIGIEQSEEYVRGIEARILSMPPTLPGMDDRLTAADVDELFPDDKGA